MAAQFCMKCGKPMPAEAQFCGACGTPVPTGGPPAGMSPGAAAPGTAPPTPAQGPAPGAPVAPAAPPGMAFPPAPPLGQTLGVEGTRNFLVQHQLFSNGRNYRILNHEKRHLFTVQENVRQELVANVLNRTANAAGQGFQFHMGRVAPQAQTYSWVVHDASGSPQGAITIQMAGNSTVSTLADSSGTPVLAVNVERSMIGGLSATAAYPDGRAMFRAHGNLLRHNFSIQDASGSEVAKVHEAWASVRDTYNLDLVGNVDPLCPIIFAILIDREKAAQ